MTNNCVHNYKTCFGCGVCCKADFSYICKREESDE